MRIPKQVDSIVTFPQKYVFTFYNILCLHIFRVVANKHILAFQNDVCFMFLFVTFSIDKYH